LNFIIYAVSYKVLCNALFRCCIVVCIIIGQLEYYSPDTQLYDFHELFCSN